jgi:hypothetical protein
LIHQFANTRKERSSLGVSDPSPPLMADGGAVKIQRIVRLARNKDHKMKKEIQNE